VTGEVRSMVVGGQQLRVAVRPGQAAAVGRPPLLLINGIGVSLEIFGPLVRELDPDVEVIMFDPPCGVPEVCMPCDLRRHGIMVIRVPAPGLSHLRPALRLAGPA
jgi:hypothetical protein